MDELTSPLYGRELTPEEKKKDRFWTIVGIIGFIMMVIGANGLTSL